MNMFLKKRLPGKVDFVIAGTQKGGTSALDKYLREHEHICMASRKEVHFFDDEKHYTKGKVNYKEYHTFFNPSTKEQIIGEATPIYMYWYDAPKRIWEYNPKMKFIISLRNPIERAYSQWNMQRMRGIDDLSFWDALQKEEERRRAAVPSQLRVHSYVDRGFYVEQLRRIWHYFPKEQTYIIKHEDLKNNPYETLTGIYDFLDLPVPKHKMAPKDVHTRPYTSALSQKEFLYLKEIFFYEIKTLENLLGWDCAEWLEPPGDSDNI